LSILISFTVNEKKAISDPENKNDNTKSINKIKARMVVEAGVMDIIVGN
jgi:hypothetical protein